MKTLNTKRTNKPVIAAPAIKPPKQLVAKPVPHTKTPTKPTPPAIVHKPVLTKPLTPTKAPNPQPIKRPAGVGFHDFKGGIMLNDGKGNLADRNDWLESIPTGAGKHIAAYYLMVPYKEWVYNFQNDCTADPDFMNWLFHVFIPREEAREKLYPNEIVQKGLTRKDMLYGLKNERVKYLDQAQRKEKIIQINQQGLFISSKGKKYHTGRESTEQGGPGWAIFVTDQKKIIYASSHIPGKFHHSSFLSGNYVATAGEIAVNNGKLVAITCKSGHYRPGSNSIIHFLKHLNSCRVNLKNVPVQLEWDFGKKMPTFYDAYEASKGIRKRIISPMDPPVK